MRLSSILGHSNGFAYKGFFSLKTEYHFGILQRRKNRLQTITSLHSDGMRHHHGNMLKSSTTRSGQHWPVMNSRFTWHNNINSLSSRTVSTIDFQQAYLWKAWAYAWFFRLLPMFCWLLSELAVPTVSLHTSQREKCRSCNELILRSNPCRSKGARCYRCSSAIRDMFSARRKVQPSIFQVSYSARLIVPNCALLCTTKNC